MKTLIEMVHEVYGEERYWTEKQLLQLKALTVLVRADERERLAKVFDELDKGIGFYDPHEPAEIIRGQA
jgi:hypothetical protein